MLNDCCQSCITINQATWVWVKEASTLQLNRFVIYEGFHKLRSQGHSAYSSSYSQASPMISESLTSSVMATELSDTYWTYSFFCSFDSFLRYSLYLLFRYIFYNLAFSFFVSLETLIGSS